MSFQDIVRDVEAGGLPPPPPLQTVVSHSVFQINTCVGTLWHLANALASCHGDAGVVRERIRRARAEATRLARNTARKLAAAGGAGDAAEPKLVAEFQAALREFQRVQQRVIAAERRQTAAASTAFLSPLFSPPAPSSYHEFDNKHQRHIQVHQQQQQHRLVESRRVHQELVRLDETEVAFNEALVHERERETCKIQQEINEINEIFRDLATLVHGQHEAIEIVECNLGAAETNTGQAEAQLTEAATTAQGKKTKSESDCMVIASVGFVVLILLLLFFL